MINHNTYANNISTLKKENSVSSILFILKRRDGFDPIKHAEISLQCGLYNSISYVNNMLIDMGIESNLEIAIDNNCIDRLVTKYRPTHVIIEALWVVPDKIKLLKTLHPKVSWIIRLHSATPFLCIENSLSMKWIFDYIQIPDVYIAVNDPRLHNEFSVYNTPSKIIYLPNYYPIDISKDIWRNIKTKDIDLKETLNISCFGAVRPFKNHMTQAMSAIEFCRRNNKNLRFHINSERTELNGGNVNTNLRHLFNTLDQDKFQLVEHPWASRDAFLEICKEIDIGLQVSFTETFNIVSADLINEGVAIVGSKEIPWITKSYIADPVEMEDIIDKLCLTYSNPEKNIKDNFMSLLEYTTITSLIWKKIFT